MRPRATSAAAPADRPWTQAPASPHRPRPELAGGEDLLEALTGLNLVFSRDILKDATVHNLLARQAADRTIDPRDPALAVDQHGDARQVLQHTEDPPGSILGLSRVLKDAGYFVGSLYMTPERPLTLFKLRFIETLRKALSIFPPRFIYYFTWLSIPCYRYWFLRPIGRLFFIRSPYDPSPAFTWNLNHDQYIGSYQRTYTREETRRFFAEAGLTALVESTEWPNMYRATKGERVGDEND